MAEVGFPAINLNSSLRDDILKKPSIKNVLTNEINAVANIPANIQSLILADTEAPRITSYNVCYTKLLRSLLCQYGFQSLPFCSAHSIVFEI